MSNIGTATYKASKYLAELLAPLAKSQYTVTSTKDFITKVRTITPPDGYEMISFDVVSLFTNVPLEKTIDIIIKKVYKEKLVKTKIKADKLRRLLLLCTKEGHFTFNDEIYQQIDGVMMGSPLGSLIANIFMCELETTIVPQLGDKLQFWMRYVDDTFAFIKRDQIGEVEHVLNSFDPKIKFTHETERDRRIAFLDVTVYRTPNNTLETSVYRKATDNNIFMNWHSHSPRSWKIGTIKNLVKRAITISSTQVLLKKELDHLTKVFHENNQYPVSVLRSIIEEEIGKHQESENSNPNEEPPNASVVPTTNEEEKRIIQLTIPYGGDQGVKMLQRMKTSIDRASKKKFNIRIVYTPSKLGTRFQVKDKTKLAHQHNVTYHIDCANKKCTSDYIGQTKCRTLKRTIQHNSRDNASHVLQHSKETKHRRVTLDNVTILGRGYRSDFKRRISESLFIKELKPDLNKQNDAYRLKLFN